MAEKPELIAFGQYSLGGVLGFYQNLLANDHNDLFDKTVVLLNPIEQKYPAPVLHFPDARVEIFSFHNSEVPATMADRMSELISTRPGVVMASFFPELASLHIHRKKGKTIFFLCHDDTYYELAKKYSFNIDFFIAHNPAMYEGLCTMLPSRKAHIYYLPYGIEMSPHIKSFNESGPLELLFLARHVKEKGIDDLPLINQKLIQAGLKINWTIFGDGAETHRFKEMMAPFPNVTFLKYETKEELFDILKTKDILVHPSSLDGLPVAMLEAMSAGIVPIVYEFNSGIRAILKDESGIVVSLGDIDTVVEKIQAFNLDRASLKRFSVNARNLISRQYDVNKQASAYYNLMNEKTGSKRRHSIKYINYYHDWLDNPVFPKPFSQLLKKIRTVVKPVTRPDEA